MNKPKKREIIKNIAIVFLVIMLILTFFSNTIMNRTLPEVNTQMVTSGPVSTQVRGDGVVEAEDPYNLVCDETRKVKSVVKRVGDHVEIDDVIFMLEGESSEELTTAKNDLESAKSDYDLAIIESGLSQAEVASVEAGVTVNSGTILTTLEAKDNEILSENNKLEEKKKKLADIQYQMSLIDTTSTPSTDYTSEENAVANAKTALEKAEKDLESAINVLEEYNNAKQIVDTKNAALANYNSAKDAYYGYTKEDGSHQDGAKEAFDKAETDYDLKKSDYQSKYSDYQTKEADYNTKREAFLNANAADADYNDKKAAMELAETAMNAAKSSSDTALAAKDTAEKKYNECKSEKDNALSALNTAESALKEAEQLSAVAPSQEDLDKATADKKAKEDAVNAKKSELAKAEEALNNKKNSSSSSSSKNEENLKGLKKQEHDISVEISDLENKIKKLEDERTNYLTEEKTKISLESKYKDILKKEKDVKDLEAKALGGEIKSPVAGEITALSYTSGEKIEAGSTVCVIQIDGKGYKLSFPVSAKQAKAVKVGDEVTVVNNWYYGDLNANLVAIQPDKNNTRDGKVLVFSLSGESVQPGQNLTLSVGEKSSNYDLVVPLSAIREDNNGKFVLILDTKNTPFGSRYVAKKVEVKVLAEDDKVAAVDGELMGWEYVITNASKHIENKDQVKLADK
ncbi:MAG: HlyD family efflux transporter periplasmic adaptor subunit [Lachnospiraceae bacterium]|nr:HlyD family efflux transporter periplasmic adaptor subunit [Lachnospiraceae bacterium]